jgi:4'-phosphopantetheinyl transferase
MTPLNCPWPAAPAHPILAEDEVHVWCAALDQPAAEYAPLLSADEQARAARFRFERERRRFTVGRGLLRLILERYLNFPAKKFQFEVGISGKPALTSDFLPQALSFNLAHSGELILYAIARNLQLGIDLEEIHPIPEVTQIAEQFFSPLERAELATLPPERKMEAFFSGWTRKEAYLKARGEGLDYPLDQFSVSIDPEIPAKLLESKEGGEELSRWSLQSLTPAPAPGYVGALALAGRALRLVQWQMR